MFQNVKTVVFRKLPLVDFSSIPNFPRVTWKSPKNLFNDRRSFRYISFTFVMVLLFQHRPVSQRSFPHFFILEKPGIHRGDVLHFLVFLDSSSPRLLLSFSTDNGVFLSFSLSQMSWDYIYISKNQPFLNYSLNETSSKRSILLLPRDFPSPAPG